VTEHGVLCVIFCRIKMKKEKKWERGSERVIVCQVIA